MTIPPPFPCAASRCCSRPSPGRRRSGGCVGPRDFLGWGGRADSSDAGLAGFASFYCILLLIKKLCVHRRPSLLFSPSLPEAPAPARHRPRGCPGPRAEPGSSEAPSGPRRPPRACPAPAPPLRPHPSAAAPGFAAQKQQRWRLQLRAPPQPRRPGETRTRRPRSARSRGEPRTGLRGGSAGAAVRTPGAPNLAALGAGPRPSASAGPR